MERPKYINRKPELLYIVGCEGKNQEKKYFEKIQQIINSISSRKMDILFDFAEPYGGNPRCIVERTVRKSIGKSNKVAVFDYDGKPKEYEEAMELACDEKIELAYTNYCFDLWLLLHKIDYYNPVSSQNDYANSLKKVYRLPNDANIKKEARVDQILAQIELEDVMNAIARATVLDSLNHKKVCKLTSCKKMKYYDNPDTQMHIALNTIFNKVGIPIS